MKPCVPFLVFTLLTFQLYAADYYWVGGGGNWSDLNHWRLGSSGGPLPSIVPGSGDNVFFDANSGFGAAPIGAKTVTLDANGFCNNMTWGSVPNSPRFITSNASITVQVSGNLVLSPTTTYYLIFAFKGATAATLTTNGNVLGEFGMDVDKTGGSLTLVDNLIVPAVTNVAGTNGVTLTSGTFDVAGKTVTLYQFNSQTNNMRTLELTNTIFNTSLAYRLTGLNKTLNAAGSTLFTGSILLDGGTYNKVTATTAAGPNTIIINNSTIKSLTFANTTGGYADIGIGNTVDSLVFNREGSIATNNTIGTVLFTLAGSIDGTGNVIRKITALNTFQVSNNYINTVDSVILAPNRTTVFRGTFNINKYLVVTGAACDAYTEIIGDSTTGTVNFASGAVVDISNVILTGVKATGPVTPIAVNGIDGTGNAGFTITEPSGSGTTLYWVNGAGDWNDKNHWSFTSGGAGGACVPFKNDNVVFDANSALASGTVTTSSSSFCKDITWTAGVGSTTFLESSAASFRVYGSITMQATVAISAIFEFYGSDAVTITTNGGGTGNVQFFIAKTGSGSVTLMDNWINNTSFASINLFSGGLNMAGRTVTCWIFASSNANTRNLDISNATITTNLRWIYAGANKQLTATGSHIISHARFVSNAPNGNYPWVDLTEVRRETTVDFDISNTVFGQLTFTNTSTTSFARVYSGNTIRRLEFKGSGYLGNNTNNNIDSLVLAGSRNYVITGTNTILQYILAEAATCSGLTEMRGSGVGTLALQGTTEVHINNVYLQNMQVTGPLAPYAVNGADAGGNTGWTINSAAGSPRYWVGGAGDWNDPNHWSAATGGAPGACVPTVYDDVYFDAGSGFTAVSKTVTVNNGNAYCKSVDWTGAANAPTWTRATTWAIEVWGNNIILNPTARFDVRLTLKGATAATLQNSVTGNFDVEIDKPGSSLTVQDDLNNSLINLRLTNGTLNAPGRTLNIASISNFGSNSVSAINISNSKITTSIWGYWGTIANHTLNAADASISTASFTANGLQYDSVTVTGTANDVCVINNTNIRMLTFSNPSSISVAGINGNNNIFQTVEYKGSGAIYGSNNEMDTLIFFPGSRYTLTAGTNNTINDAWYGSGTPCRATEIVSSSTTANATITKVNGDVNFDYVRLQRITAAGTASPFEARSHTTDLGNNVSWVIAPYDGAAPIEGLGRDTALALDAFPYVLRTGGFFGTPSSQYVWSDASTADTLVITAPGTYSVDVNFVDGCSINDAIIVTEAIPLPITITNFKAVTEGCVARLAWKTADALHFSHFMIEQSKDGRNFTTIGQVLYAKGIEAYSYTDQTPGNGTTWYRLKLVDIDEKFEYSTVASVRTDCGSASIQVRPTITHSNVQVVLPQGYEKAQVYLIDAMGQRIVPVIHGAGQFRTLSLQGLPAATYILQVINGRDVNTFKIIKQ